MHRYQRGYLVPRVLANQPPLGQFHTWFPFGPKVDFRNTIPAAEAAAAIGAEVYVLDPGGTRAATGSGPWAITSPIPASSPEGSRSWRTTSMTRA